MTLVFWLSVGLIVYVYLGYPALLGIWAPIRREAALRAAGQQDLPGVSIIVAARNEAQRLPGRLDNLLALDYPADRRQIVVVSDGSTDDTASVLAAYDGVVDLVPISASGKASALNAGVAHAKHEILVFADARQLFAPDALRALVAPFTDPQIGAVSGELILDCEDHTEHAPAPAGSGASTVSTGISLYWRYEKWLRRHESAIRSLLGVTGAIYALRRSLWHPLPPETLLDDVLAPMRVVLDGCRVILEDRASAESRRKVRTLAGNVQVLWLEPRLLLPWVNPVWVQYCSHKVGRLLVPYALLAAIASNIALADRHVLYAAALSAQCVFYLLAGYGACLEWRSLARTAAAKPPATRTGLAWAADRPAPRKGVVNA